jgi:copper chaperone CopZ
MRECEHATASGLRTIEVRVPGANCPWCFNDAMAQLRHLTGVAEVRASIHDDCIEVRHRDVPVPLVVNTLRTYLHGTDDSRHECQMVAVEPEVVSSTCGCSQSTPPAGERPEPTRPMETLVEAMARLRRSGYANDFAASPNGSLVCRSCGTHQEPESIEICETVRFEGDSNPDDEAILLALACADGCLGQYSAAFGPGTATADVRALERLTPTRR